MIDLRCSHVDDSDLVDRDVEAFIDGLHGREYNKGSREDYNNGQLVRVFDDETYRQLILTQHPLHR